MPCEGSGHHEFDHADASGPVPGFTLDGLIGEGGMGLVYRAVQHRPRRAVALKLLKPGVVTARTLRRFEREAEILARLQHPAIARVFEAGVTPGTPELGEARQPTPYFVMELIDGVGLNRYAERAGLSTRDRLELFAEVCDAVHYAHQQGVVHRDLKPANILVDAAGHPKVLDFGIARMTGGDQPLTTLQTDIGQMLGTLPYMSPEQVVGDPDSAAARSDVYALGVTLYELLSGRLPYNVNTASVLEAARVIRDEEPAPLSVIDRTLRGDVETIVGRCLEKEPHRRYASAEALAQDIRRYLDFKPIRARPPGGWYQATRFAKRNKTLVAGLAAVFVTLVLGMVGTSLGRSQALEAREREAQQRAAAELQRREAQLAAERAEASERAMARALGEEKRMRELAQKQSRLANNTSSLYIEMINGINPIVARGRDVSLLVRVMEIGEGIAAERLGSHPEDESKLRYEIGHSYLTLGMNDKANEQLEKAYELSLRSQGPASMQTQDCLVMLGKTSLHRGEFQRSIDYNREAIASLRRLRGIESSIYAIATHNLGNSYHQLDRLEDTVALNDSLIALLPYVKDADAGFENDLYVAKAVMMMQFGEMQPAYEVLDRVYHRQVERNGVAHPDSISTAMNLAWAMIETDRPEDAIELINDILPEAKVIHRDEPRMIIRMQVTLASAYSASRQIDMALPLQRELLDYCTRTLGEDHPETLSMHYRIGESLYIAGRFAEARPYLETSIKGNREALGLGHPHTLNGIHTLAIVLTNLREFDLAEQYFETYLSTASRVWGEDFISVYRVRLSHGNCVLDSGDRERAARLAESLYEDASLTFGHDHYHSAEFATFYAERLVEDGDLEEAEQVLLDALEALKDAPAGAIAELSRKRVRAAELMALVYQRLGFPDRGAYWREEAESIREGSGL